MRDRSLDDRRTAGFLYPSERAYLDEEGVYPGPLHDDSESGGRKAKSSIKNEVAAPGALKWLLLDFYRDLSAVSNYHRTDREAWQEWEQDMLPHVEQELRLLRDLIDQMVDAAERNRFKEDHEELIEALSHLYEGDNHPSEAYRIGDVTSLEETERPAEFDEMSPDELEQRFEALQIRQRGLQAVLDQEEGPAILEYIAENGPVALSGERVGDGGEPWAAVAKRILVKTELARAYDDTWDEKFELTDHGQAVVECWRALTETAAVEREQDALPDPCTREAVQFVLELHELPVTAGQ